MAVGDDDVIEDYSTPLHPSSTETKQSVDLLSSEGAWPDSSLIKDHLLDSSWDSLKHALLETFDSPTNSLNFGSNVSLEAKIRMMRLRRGTKGVDIKALTNAGEEEADEDHLDDNSDTDDDDNFSRLKMENFYFPMFNESLTDLGISAREEKTNEDHIEVHNDTILSQFNMENISLPTFNESLIDLGTSAGEENTDKDQIDDTLSSRFNMENVFLPTFSESLRDLGKSDSDLDFDFPAFVIDDHQAPTDIFKVWDLDTPDEEDELIIQLNKALAESGLKTSPPSEDDSIVLENLKEVDDLISGLADLSLIEDSV